MNSAGRNLRACAFTNRKIATTSMGAVLVALGCTQPAFAQAAAAESQGPQVEEIVVTAQKRSENLQSVPVAVSAVTGAAATAAGIRTASDLAVNVSSLTVQNNTTATIFYIRGVGTAFGSPGLDSTIATFVDGVYIPSMTGSTLSLNNIARVEVLKGPQGTLYGRNATGGAINIITRTPSHTTSVEGSLGYGNKHTVDGTFYGTTGLGDAIAVDLAAFYHNQAKGFGTNIFDGSDLNKSKEFNIRSKVLIELGDTKITLAGDYASTTSSYGISFRPGPTSILVNGQTGYNGGYYDTNTDVDPFFRVRQEGASAKIEQDFGSIKLTSLTAYRYQKVFQIIDLDTTALNLLAAPLHSSDGQFTEELQLGYTASRLDLTLGAFYLSSYNKFDPFTITGLGLTPLTELITNDRQGTKSVAIFGQGTYKVLDDTNLTLGARYTHDKRTLTGQQSALIAGSVVPIAAPLDKDASFSKATWRIALDHKFTPDIMTYASYSRGFKSGVFNLSSPTDPVVRPETLDAYEIGLKSNLFDRRLRFNPAFFFYKYKNIQLNQDRGTTTLLVNASAARIYGIDFDTDIAVTEQFSIRGGGAWTHARYRNFQNAPYTQPNPAAPFGNIESSGDASGHHMIITPGFSGNIQGNYKTDLASGKLDLNVSYAYSGSYYWASDNRVKQNAYGLLASQIMWTSPDGGYNVRIWGRNLTNKHYLANLNENGTGDILSPAAGRLFGGSVGFKF